MLNMHFQRVQDEIWKLGTALNGSKQFFVLSFLFIPFVPGTSVLISYFVLKLMLMIPPLPLNVDLEGVT